MLIFLVQLSSDINLPINCNGQKYIGKYFKQLLQNGHILLCLHLRNYNSLHLDTYHNVIAMAILLEECQQHSKLIL